MDKSVKSSKMSVAIGLVFNPDRHVLVSQRPENKSLPGFWEFPGGKCEEGEGAKEAVVRELYEEVGIVVGDLTLFYDSQQDLSVGFAQSKQTNAHLSFFKVEQYQGVPFGREGQVVRWVSSATLQTLEMPKGNTVVIESLLLEGLID